MMRVTSRFLCLMLLTVACGDGHRALVDAAASADGVADNAIQDSSIPDLTRDLGNDAGLVDGSEPVDAALDVALDVAAPPLPTPDPLPACDAPREARGLIPGPGQAGFDEALALKARRFERVFHAVSATGHGANADLLFRDQAGRTALDAFAHETDDWTFDASAHVAHFAKVAGLYGGVGFATDAYRYAELRDRGAACAEVERARDFLLADLEVLHAASAITGTPGVIARALALVNLPGSGQRPTVPLLDEAGSPLPADKNNGTWRADQSGDYPEFIWEDSCSRDMYVGWALAYAAMWEAIATDPSFEDALKVRIRRDATELLDSLRVVRESGYDLEIRDADGRRTYHGILNENSIDRVYAPGLPNGFNGYMAVGIVGALAYVTDHPRHWRYLEDELVDERGLLRLARDSMLGVDQGLGSNYSAYNMAFTAGWLAIRYVRRAEDRLVAREAVRVALYQRPDRERQPVEQDQAFYDLVEAAAEVGVSAYSAGSGVASAMPKIARILTEFPAPPYFDDGVINCDEAEIESLDCVAEDGSRLPLEASLGRGNTLVAVVPVPMHLRPPSNFHWRSNPYRVNAAGSGLGLLPGTDFRFVYWAGRWLRGAPQ